MPDSTVRVAALKTTDVTDTPLHGAASTDKMDAKLLQFEPEYFSGDGRSKIDALLDIGLMPDRRCNGDCAGLGAVNRNKIQNTAIDFI